MDRYFNRQQLDFLRFTRSAIFTSLLVGSLLIMAYYVSEYRGIAFLGIFHLLVSAILSGWVLVRLLAYYRRRHAPKRQILLALALMALSYAIAALYLYIGLRVYSNSGLD